MMVMPHVTTLLAPITAHATLALRGTERIALVNKFMCFEYNSLMFVVKSHYILHSIQCL